MALEGCVSVLVVSVITTSLFVELARATTI